MTLLNKSIRYYVDFDQWGINAFNSNPIETTKGFNEALIYASENNFPIVEVPKGNFIIDSVNTLNQRNPEIGGGIKIPSNMELLLDPEAVFQVNPNGYQGYSCFYIGLAENVIIRGGRIIGDRYQHDYSLIDTDRKTHEWGFGIHVHGSKNVLIENVQISDCIGDNIWIAAHGMMNYPGMVYTPSKSVTVRKCELKRGRRNNLATNGCEGLLVEDCDIEEAGGDTIGPQLGIDLEGYGENGRKYDHPYELTISDCRFRKNGRGSVTAHTSGKVSIKDNYCDNVISYGYSTDVSIKGNKIINEGGSKEYGIDSVGVSSTETGNRIQITDNNIQGFKIGMMIRGKGVSIDNNTVKNASNCAIATHMAEDVSISNNRIQDSDCIQIQVRNSSDIKVSNNKGKGTTSAYAIKVMDSNDVKFLNNTFSNLYGGLYCERSQAVRIKLNDFLLSRKGYGIYWDKDSEVFLTRNEIFEPRNVAIMGAADMYNIRISDNQIYNCKAIIAIHLIGGSEHMVRGNEIMFNRDSDQGYGIYLNGTKKVRLIRNDVQGIGARVLSHPFATFNASSTTLIHNTYDSGTPRLALDDTVIDYK